MKFYLLFFTVHAFAFTSFPSNYEEGRERFVNSCIELEKLRDDIRNGDLPILTKKLGTLTIDWCYIPAKKNNENLIILSSGVHGAEAFVGSALQKIFLEKLKTSKYENTSFLLIHAINPWGFFVNRRVSENNVDLNRNFSLDSSLYKRKNPHYSKLNDFLNPKRKVEISMYQNVKYYLQTVFLVLKEGMKTLKQSIAGGQYISPKGIFFGGTRPDPQVNILENFLKPFILNYKRVFPFDIHTGLGTRGVLHLIAGRIVDEKKSKTLMNKIIPDQKVDYGKDKDFYETSGDFIDFVSTISRKENIQAFPLTLEYGTLDSDTIFGALNSLKIVKEENQNFHYGAKSKSDQEKVLRSFSEMFNPTDKKWRKMAINAFEGKVYSIFEKIDKL